MKRFSQFVLAFLILITINSVQANLASSAVDLNARLKDSSVSAVEADQTIIEQKIQELKLDLNDKVNDLKKKVEIYSDADTATEKLESISLEKSMKEQVSKKANEVIKEKTKMESETLESKELEAVKAEENAAEKFVLVKTDKGDFTVKLFMEDAPITAGNFLDLVERHFYDGLTFHRIIAGFVVQGGCPKGNGTGNFIDPETKQPRYIKHEWSPKHSHDRAGILAMARTADPDSASSQFFIDLAPLDSLNPGGVDPFGYSVFGMVTEGMDTINKIVEENVAPYPGSDGTSNPVKIISAEVQ